MSDSEAALGAVEPRPRCSRPPSQGKIEISDARWAAIEKVAKRDGLPAQVVLDHILDFGQVAS